jgi:TPR repeat protein
MQIKKLFILTLCMFMTACATHSSTDNNVTLADNNSSAQLTGSPDELYKMGNHYAQGRGGVARDDKKAVAYYLAAARGGNAKAQYALGYMYRSGRGVTPNYDVAAAWFGKAADQGNADAQNSLGVRYLLGQGTPKDYTQATYWFQKAADKGNPYAANELGFMYAAGKGVTQDYPTAIEWYTKAADKGLPSAQYNLGLIYATGLGGTTVDKPKALALFQRAAARGFAPARHALTQYG